MRIFLLAAIVVVVFALIAALDTTGRCLGQTSTVWLVASLLGFYLDQLLGGWVAVQIGAHRTAPARPAE